MFLTDLDRQSNEAEYKNLDDTIAMKLLEQFYGSTAP